MRTLIIAIDGPAASGKSTTARLVAQRLGFLHLDTGAMYRAVTLKVLQAGLDPENSEEIRQLLETTHVELRKTDGTIQVLLDGKDVSEEIRSLAVTESVSAVSALAPVREVMVREQRRVAEQSNIVAEGRDIGTVVFPDADLKFFIIAGIEARAERRRKELLENGVEADLPSLVEAIRVRDMFDASRAVSPLRKADDAIELDTSNLSIEEQVEFVVRHVRALQAEKREG